MDRSPLRTPSVPRRKGLFVPAVGLVVALVAGACSAGGSVAPSTSSPLPVSPSPVAATPSPSPSPSPQATQPAFPLTLTDDEGTSVTIPHAPSRIVSLTPASTEELFALGEGSLLVGDTDSDDYPAAAKTLPHVATYQGVVMEKLVAAQPDLVIAGGNGFTHPADVTHMRSLGIPVVVVYAATVPAVLADLRLVGEAVRAASRGHGHDRGDADPHGRHRRAGAAPSRPIPRSSTRSAWGPTSTPRPRTRSSPTWSASPAARPSRPATPTPTPSPSRSSCWPTRRSSSLGDYDYGTAVADVLKRPGWEHLTAVVDGAVRPVDDTIVTRPGPRLADGLAALALAIDPGLVLPADLLPPATPAPSPS